MNNAFLLTMTVHFALCLNADPMSTPAPTAASYSEAEPSSAAVAATTAKAASQVVVSTTPRSNVTSSSSSGAAAAPPPPPPPPTGTVAPLLLAHIFDTHSPINKHHHHDHRWGPHFEQEVANATNVTVQAGETANLNCRISLLQDKTVSWVRRSQDSGDMQLLTVGVHTYSGDDRYTVQFQYPNNWRLQVREASRSDAGLYECQVSTHPPRATQYFLHVNAPEVMIVDEHGRRLHDKYYEADSTIQLSCLVRHVAMTSSVVTWLHGDRALNYDTTRGGISVRTDLTGEGANSSLSVARVDKADSGNYTCAISPSEYATIAVHVLNAESLAELHLSGCPRQEAGNSLYMLWLLVAFILAHR